VTTRIGSTVSGTADAIATSRAADAIADRRAAIALTLAVIAGLALLAWIGGELHYRNCLAKAEMENPSGFSYVAPNPKNVGSVGYLTPTRLDEAASAADACTRVPW
jgi:hypothetical protein